MTVLEPRRTLGVLIVAALAATLAAGGVLAATDRAESDESAAPQSASEVGSSASTALPRLPESPRVSAQRAHRADSRLGRDRPSLLQLSSGTVVPVDPAVTSPTGGLQLPDDIDRAGWWNGGARLGDSYGAMVLASHVDSTTQGLGPFAELLAAAPGDALVVGSVGLRQEFSIATVELIPAADLAARDDLFAQHDGLRLVLITCAGPYLPDQGGYQNLAVVTAQPAGVVQLR